MTEKDLFFRKSQRPHYLVLTSHGYVRVLMSIPATLLTSSLSNAKSSRLPRVVTHIFVATSYSKRKGPLKGEDHQIWRLGVCLLSTQVPCGPIPMLRTPCCEGRDERWAREGSVVWTWLDAPPELHVYQLFNSRCFANGESQDNRQMLHNLCH
jgi:hypothetical protein